MKKMWKMLGGAVALTAMLMFPVTDIAAAYKKECTEYNESNEKKNRYGQYTGNYDHVIRSNLVALSDGSYMKVQAEVVDGKVAAEYYDASFAYLGRTLVDMELSRWGGFYATESNYYVITGQENLEDDDTVEVYRITQYDKEWNRISSDSLYGANTHVPFAGGSLRCTHSGNYLLIKTCHTMYASQTDGRNHQANVMIQYDMTTGKIVDSRTEVSNISTGYVSHSFNQFIRMDGDKIVGVDHGDAYPRSVVLTKGMEDFTQRGLGSRWGSYESVDLLTFKGKIGSNVTGADIGGLEVSSSNYLVVGNTKDQSEDSTSEARNIFVAAIEKSLEGSLKIKYLTNDTDEDYELRNTKPLLVKVRDDYFVILWTKEDTLYYAAIDGNGNKIGKTYTYTGTLSDCQPIVSNGQIIWYTYDNDENTFYTIDTTDLSKIKTKKTDTGHTYSFVSKKADGEVTLRCNDCKKTVTKHTYTGISVFMNDKKPEDSDYYRFYGANKYNEAVFHVGDTVNMVANGVGDSNFDVVYEYSNNNVKVTSSIGSNIKNITFTKNGAVTVKIYPKYNPEAAQTVTFYVGEASKPQESKPVVTKQAETKPTETKKQAETTKPTETKKQAETTKPTETKKPEETKPTETKKPEETKPTQTKKPAETKPTETKKPEETKPTETKKQVETTKPTASSYTGLKYQNGAWYALENGKKQSKYTGLKYDAEVGWWYVKNGVVDFDYNGLVEYNGGWWCIAQGRVAFEYTGLWNDAKVGWWYVENGMINFTASGLVEYNGGWWCVAEGRVALEYTGLWNDAKVGWWYVENGMINFTANGLVEYNGGWWCVAEGRVALEYTGLWNDAKVGWWYVNNGMIDFEYTGEASNEAGNWYVVNGQVDFS